MSRLAIVVPAYNESENISELCDAIFKAASPERILIIDDSPDERTVQAVAAMKNSKIMIQHRRQKEGRGSAVVLGIQQLLLENFEYILEIDADLSHPPSQIPEMLSLATRKQLDLVIASRYLPNSKIKNWPLSRRLFSNLANKIARFLLKVPVTDYTNGYRLYSRRAATIVGQNCGKLGSGFISLSEILVNLYYTGFKIDEVPTIFSNRVRGTSSLNRKEISNAILGLAKIYSLKRELSK